VSVFDSRLDDKQYWVSTQVIFDGRMELNEHGKPLPDPFVSHSIIIRPAFWRRVRQAFRREPIQVWVSIKGSREVMEAVLELDSNYSAT
jgi:hypothetical protein